MKRKTLAALTCILLFSLTACGKEDKPSASIQTDGQTVVVYDNANDSSETFELINESITLEAGELLDTNVETYVRTKHPENISVEDIENLNEKFTKIYGAIPLMDYDVEFRDITTGERKTMAVTVVDTIPPEVTINSNEATIYIRELDVMQESVRITNPYLPTGFSLDITDATVCNAYYKSDGERNLASVIAAVYQVNSIKPGEIEDILVVVDMAGNEIEIPVTLHLIDELPPDVQ